MIRRRSRVYHTVQWYVPTYVLACAVPVVYCPSKHKPVCVSKKAIQHTQTGRNKWRSFFLLDGVV